MAAGPEISIESSAMNTPSGVIDQSLTGNEVSSVKNLDIESVNFVNSKENDGCVVDSKNGSDSDPKSDTKLKEFVDILSLKLNPMAKEFFPSYYFKNYPQNGIQNGIQCYPNNRRRKHNYSNTQRPSNGRAFRAQREDSIKRTVYVSEIDHNVTEEQLAALFSGYGHVLDCRVCGDPHSRLRFAFVEFADERSAKGALNLAGTMLGFSQITVLPSKTAILPVNPTFLPRSEDEREMCARTVYCTNIDKKVSQTEVKNFFETRCGEVSRLRLLGDNVHSTRIAFVEFLMAESAIMALDCCGQQLGAQPIRVSPSKTPVRPRAARPLSSD